VDAIHLAPLSQGFGIGTPVIDTRAQACGYSCDQVDCLRACPTGALRRGGEGDAAVNPDQPIKPQAVPMGLAVLVSPEICLAVQGKPIQSYARESNFKGMLRVHRSTGWTERPVNKERYFRSICDLCAMECPITGAIRMKTQTDSKSGRAFLAPVVLPDCVGCGVCEMVCPTQPASIQIVAGKRHPDTVMTQPSRA
jgi:ferredoxin-type protein NapG